MQVLDLVTDRGFFHKLNLSVPTDDFLDVINEFSKPFDDIYFSFSVGWPGESPTFVSEILTPFGLCLNFNLAFSHDVLHINTTSNDFNYQLFMLQRELDYLWDETPSRPELLPRRVLTSFQSGVTISAQVDMTKDVKDVISNDFNGHLFILHDPFELPTMSSKILKIHDDRPQEILIYPQMNSIDESIAGFDPVE